jgi:hypothetical protein
MKHISETNKDLLREIILYQETDELTVELKKIFMELIWLETKNSKYEKVTDNVKILCESKAYEDCCKNSIYFNPDKSDKPSLYMINIIRCSYSIIIKKYSNNLLKSIEEKNEI